MCRKCIPTVDRDSLSSLRSIHFLSSARDCFITVSLLSSLLYLTDLFSSPKSKSKSWDGSTCTVIRGAHKRRRRRHEQLKERTRSDMEELDQDTPLPLLQQEIWPQGPPQRSGLSSLPHPTPSQTVHYQRGRVPTRHFLVLLFFKRRPFIWVNH